MAMVTDIVLRIWEQADPETREAYNKLVSSSGVISKQKDLLRDIKWIEPTLRWSLSSFANKCNIGFTPEYFSSIPAIQKEIGDKDNVKLYRIEKSGTVAARGSLHAILITNTTDINEIIKVDFSSSEGIILSPHTMNETQINSLRRLGYTPMPSYRLSIRGWNIW